MSSNLVRDHTCDKTNQNPAMWSSNFVNHFCDNRPNWTPLSPITIKNDKKIFTRDREAKLLGVLFHETILQSTLAAATWSKQNQWSSLCDYNKQNAVSATFKSILKF